MAKKKIISGGFNTLVGGSQKTPATPEKKKRGRPKTQNKIVEKSSEEGTKEGETRATFIVKKETLKKFKALSYWRREKIKETVEKALSQFIDKADKTELGEALEYYKQVLKRDKE